MPLTVEEVAEEAKPEEVSSLAPEFLEKPRYQTVNEGETVTFKGTVEAAPQPEVSIPVCLKGDQKQSNISAVGIEYNMDSQQFWGVNLWSTLLRNLNS